MSLILVPEAIGPGLTLRWFVEYAVDNSPLFRSASAVAKAALILNADLDKVGEKIEIPGSALKLLREALESEEQPLPLPELFASATDSEGKPVGEPVKVPPRVFGRFIQTLATDEQP